MLWDGNIDDFELAVGIIESQGNQNEIDYLLNIRTTLLRSKYQRSQFNDKTYGKAWRIINKFTYPVSKHTKNFKK